MARRVDIALTALLSIGAIGIALGRDGGGPVAAALAPAATLPLLWWRRTPLLAAVALAAGSIVSAVPTFMQTRCGAMIPVALLIAFSVASRSGRRDALAGLAALLFALAVLLVTDPLLDTGALFVLALCGALWGAGRVVRARTRLARELRARAADLARRRAEVARLRLEVERSRLGRDIDAATRERLRAIVAGARLAVDLNVPGRQAAFAEIERTARASLHEMRDILGTLHADAPAPSAAPPAPPPPAVSAPVMSARVSAATLAGAAAVIAIAALGVDGRSPRSPPSRRAAARPSHSQPRRRIPHRGDPKFTVRGDDARRALRLTPSGPQHPTNPRSIAIELITAILLAGPIGYLVSDRRKSVVTYLAVWAVVFPIQTISVSHDGHLVSLYWVVNALILCLGLAANHQGARLRRARHRRAAARRSEPNRLTAAD